ncbi:hypothetical protein GCM10009802_25650 [Streptomyces synnematoformans]|uniref:Uncharacterized protein n=1 Tax=Streptomyces synnematoformans TaxID=415721 RepID=A0ABN2Y693_9ACTN
MFEGHCPHCGWADSTPFHTVSRHRTAGGMTIWTRCQCGSLQMRTIDAAGGRIVTRGRPAPDAAGGPYPAGVRQPAVPRVERCHES